MLGLAMLAASTGLWLAPSARKASKKFGRAVLILLSLGILICLGNLFVFSHVALDLFEHLDQPGIWGYMPVLVYGFLPLLIIAVQFTRLKHAQKLACLS